MSGPEVLHASPAPAGKPMRIVFMAGPGDALQSFERWTQGQENQAILSLGYSTQFYAVCKELGAQALAWSTHPRPGRASQDGITVEHRGDPFAGKNGARYQLQHLSFARDVLEEVGRFQANVALIGGEPHPILLSPLYRNGITVIQSLHCPLWSEFGVVSPARRSLTRLMADFYENPRNVVLSASAAVTSQVRELSGPAGCAVVEFFPTYRQASFRGIAPPDHARRPFRIFFAGRIEQAKGVFELLELARRLKAAGHNELCFDVCGDGSSLPALRRRAQELGQGDTFALHGWCEPQRLREHLGRSHVVIVPTNTEYGEGFNQVVIEGLLAGRPVLTSEVCPAVQYVRPAVVVHRPDDLDGYGRTIVGLATDRDRYQALLGQAAPTSRKFLDEKNSYAAALRHVLVALRAGGVPTSLTVS